MECLRTALLVILLICAVPRQSHGSFGGFLRKLAQADGSADAANQTSPSPNPAPAPNLDYENSPQSPLSQPSCEKVSNKCDIKDYSITACVPIFINGPQHSYVLVLNSGKSSLKLNIMVNPAKTTLEDMLEPGQAKKVDLPSNMDGNSSITINVGNAECVIQMKSPITQGFYTSYLTPISGTYLFFVATLFFGGTFVCCKLVKRGSHPNGVPYQELEMEQQDSNSTFVIETRDEGWDENWDDEWDEEKAVRSLGKEPSGKVIENGGSLNYIDAVQWGDDWGD